MRKALAALLLISIILFSSIGLAVYTLPKWGPQLSKHLLKSYEIDLQQISFGHINWQQAELNNVRLTYRNTLWHADQIQLNYAWHNLRQAQLDSVLIPQLTLTIKPAVTHPLPTPPTNFSNFLPSRWMDKLPVKQLTISDLTLQLPTHNLHGNLEFSDQQLSLTLTTHLLAQKPQPEKQLQLAALIQQDNQIQLALNQVDANQTADSILTIQSTLDNVNLNGKLDATAEKILRLLKELDLFHTDLQLQGPIHANWQWPFTTLTSATSQADLLQHLVVHLNYAGEMQLSKNLVLWGLNKLKLQSQLQLTTQQINGTLKIQDADDLIHFNGQLQHQFGSAQGELNLIMQPLIFTESQAFLPKLFPQWPYPFDFTQGTLSHTANLHWQNTQLQGDHQFNFNQVGAFYQKMLFKGIDSQMQLKHQNQSGWQLQGKSVNIAEIDQGLVLHKLHCELRATSAQIALQDLKADLFGGHALAQTMIYDIATGSSLFNVGLQGIQLQEVLKTQSRLRGEGLVDGLLPVRIRNNTISLQKGQITSRPPGGVLQLQTDQSTSKNLGPTDLQLAIQLLKNFHFQQLAMQVDYVPSGDLSLATQFKGSNPDWQQGRAVNFNLNLNQNVPALLAGMQLSQNISEKLEQRIKALYKP